MQPMRLYFPLSLSFFVLAILVYALQTIPQIGIFLMLVAGMFWSVFLVNAGMVGIAVEAAIGLVSRLWLVLPALFYGGYWTMSALDHMALRSLAAEYDAANARVVTRFDPTREALVFEKNGNGAWLTQNYSLPVAYTDNPSVPERFFSQRLMDRKTCDAVRDNPALKAASVHTFGFHDSDRRFERRFCNLNMPERPELPLVRVSKQEEKVFENRLPVTRVVTTITMADGRQFRLLGGVAAPLPWIPMPVMGCALNSGTPSWDCVTRFWRKRFTPILSGTTRYHRDTAALARALGLKPVATEDRRAADPGVLKARMKAAKEATLARQLTNLETMIEDPVAKARDWQMSIILSRPNVLDSRADAIMDGLERAAVVAGPERRRARESGRKLSTLVAGLPDKRFRGYGPRLLALYNQADGEHWLWERSQLLARLGDLGTDALPYLVDPPAQSRSPNRSRIEAICRVGPAGRTAAQPVLIEMWIQSRDVIDRDARADLFVAMRRLGISPPPLPKDKNNQRARLETEWADISPQSPPRVCTVWAEREARRRRKLNDQRAKNLN